MNKSDFKARITRAPPFSPDQLPHMPTITCSVSIETAWQWVSKFKCGPIKSTLISTTFEAFDEWKTVKQKICDEMGMGLGPKAIFIFFMFDGFIIEDEATPYSLGIEDGDVIEGFASFVSFLTWPRNCNCGKY